MTILLKPWIYIIFSSSILNRFEYTIELNNEQDKEFSKILKENGENPASYLKKILLEKLEDFNDLKKLDEAIEKSKHTKKYSLEEARKELDF